MFSRILVAVDGSDASRQGLSSAIEVAAEQRAALFVLHVVEGMPASWSNYVDREFRPTRMELLLQGLRASGQRLLDDARALAQRHGQPTELLLVDARGRTFADVTLAEARRIGADVVVLGTHGRDGMSRLVKGSEAESLLRRSDVPVLLVREKAAVVEAKRQPVGPEPAGSGSSTHAAIPALQAH
jgi:nucleotide-binding universal stress UspA family protein